MASVSGILSDVLPGAAITLQIAAGAWIVSAVVGLVLALAADSGRRFLTFPVAASVSIVRSLPQLVILYVLYFGISQFGISLNSMIAAIVGLGIADAVFTAEYYRA